MKDTDMTQDTPMTVEEAVKQYWEHITQVYRERPFPIDEASTLLIDLIQQQRAAALTESQAQIERLKADNAEFGKLLGQASRLIADLDFNGYSEISQTQLDSDIHSAINGSPGQSLLAQHKAEIAERERLLEEARTALAIVLPLNVKNANLPDDTLLEHIIPKDQAKRVLETYEALKSPHPRARKLLDVVEAAEFQVLHADGYPSTEQLVKAVEALEGGE